MPQAPQWVHSAPRPCLDCMKIETTFNKQAALHPALHQEVMQMYELQARLTAYAALYFAVGFSPCWGSDELPPA